MEPDQDKTAPFDLAPRSPPASSARPTPRPVLLLHGFTGSPAELLPLGQQLAAAGRRAVAPRLPGHGPRPADLARAGADCWLQSARAALAALPPEPLHVIGLSMGALLALCLAAESPLRLRSLTLLAPALRLLGLGGALSLLLQWAPMLRRAGSTVPMSQQSDLRDPTYRSANPKNGRLPLFGLAELGRLQRLAEAAADRVRAPTLIVLGAKDRTVDNRRGQRLSERLGAKLFIADRSGHQLGLDFDRLAVAEAILAHLAGAEAAANAL